MGRELSRPWLKGCLVALGFCVIAFLSAFGYMAFSTSRHRNWYRSVELRILMLAERGPAEVAPEEWAYYVESTWNLHANHGTPMDFESSARVRFLEEFDRRLDGRVDSTTIDWIWDEYASHSRGGREYARGYRPTMTEMRRGRSKGELGKFELERLLDDLRRRKASRQQ